MKINVYPHRKGARLSDLYGIFLEDLNHAADGGLYAEMVQNRSFEFDPIDNETYHHLTAWEKLEGSGRVRLVVEYGGCVSQKNPHYLGIDILEPGEVGVKNTGFLPGMCFRKGSAYRFVCYSMREQDLHEPLIVSLLGDDGGVLDAVSFTTAVSWQRTELPLKPDRAASAGALSITCKGRGFDSYREAIDYLVDYLNVHREGEETC